MSNFDLKLTKEVPDGELPPRVGVKTSHEVGVEQDAVQDPKYEANSNEKVTMEEFCHKTDFGMDAKYRSTSRQPHKPLKSFGHFKLGS